MHLIDSTVDLHNFIGKFAPWIVIAVCIAVYSTTPIRAGINVFAMENSWRYGFILRYPNDKSDITGIIYEPWHYRYVGEEAAKEIYDLDVCLEEYLY